MRAPRSAVSVHRDMTKRTSGRGSFFVKRFFIPGVALLMLCGGAKAQKSSAPEKGKSDDDKKIEIRNNAASLLADLLGDEKNLGKILIIKHPAPGVDKLVKEIAKTAGDEADELEKMAKADKALNLQAMQLPPGETATRSAISRTKEHDLLFSSGTEFELNLLLTQTDALEYGSHLARVAAANSPSPEVEKQFHAMDVALDGLWHRVVAAIRGLHGK